MDRDDRDDGNRHFSRHRITIYDDPRDYVGGQPNAIERSRESSFIYHSSPRIDFSRSTIGGSQPESHRFGEEFYDDRGRW